MYDIKLPEAEPKTYQVLKAAKAFADKVAIEQGIELEVVNTETGTVTYLTSPALIAKRDAGVHFVPWSRLETPKFAAPVVEGFYPAYNRVRVGAVVYRAYDEAAELPWMVLDTRTGGRQLVPTTKAARMVTNAMRAGLMLEAA
jgi:hypothetical protein